MRQNNLHFKNNDEMYTPEILVEPIIKYIKKEWTVWCPFDTEKSNFVQLLKKNGFKVVYGHISDGKDFFQYEPENWDCIVSNPPFSLKLEIFKRLYELKKPFAILMNLECLNYQVIGNFFLDKKLQLLIPDKKVSFNGRTAAFNTSYFCNGILPNDLMFVHLERNK